MKLLILVQASEKEPFDSINNCQRKTWGSIHIDNVDTFYYYGSNREAVEGDKIHCNCPDDYNMMGYRMKLTLEAVWDWDWDFIFRSNTSTYIRKDRIYNYVRDMKIKDGVYAGTIGGDMISGTGVILSRDTAKILMDSLDDYPSDSEDCLMGSMLGRKGILPQGALERKQFNFLEDLILDADYYRCKSEIMKNGKFGYDDLDRTYDIKAMNEIHKHLYK